MRPLCFCGTVPSDLMGTVLGDTKCLGGRGVGLTVTDGMTGRASLITALAGKIGCPDLTTSIQTR